MGGGEIEVGGRGGGGGGAGGNNRMIFKCGNGICAHLRQRQDPFASVTAMSV